MTSTSRDNSSELELLTFGDHLEVLRRMLFRIIIVVFVLSCGIFCFKNQVFDLLLAPRNYDFYTFRLLERIMGSIGWDFRFPEYHIPLINTQLSSQFMIHITTSCILGMLCASPYILAELFCFISPALYSQEKKYSYIVAVIIYCLFVLGVLMTYFVLFPISFRFLGTYQVSDQIPNTITLDSYISTFTTLTFMMGIVFQLPVIAFVLGKMSLIDAALLRKYRPYALVLIMIIAAIITPPDIFTLILCTIPIYLLYELSILVLSKSIPKPSPDKNSVVQ